MRQMPADLIDLTPHEVADAKAVAEAMLARGGMGM
jgi:hypothetical protein